MTGKNIVKSGPSDADLVTCQRMTNSLYIIIVYFVIQFLAEGIYYNGGKELLKYWTISEPKRQLETAPTGWSFMREVNTSQIASACLFELKC